MASRVTTAVLGRPRLRVGLAAGAGLAALLTLGGGASAATASSGSTFAIHGGGDGHGIGMSQYGALGFAQHGWSYRQILAHYYRGTNLGTVSPARIVTVLLEDGSASFRGASRADRRALAPGITYTVRNAPGGRLELTAPGLRKPIGPFVPPLTVSGSGPLDLARLGNYRGSLVFRPDGSGGIETVNALDIEDYVRGVISAEMPASWPMAALEAQAIAARTYVLTAGAISGDYQVYSDTRSQMYRGVAAETPSTNAAVAATRGQVVTYAGAPAVTYFFASSGGYTEDIQNVWLGVTPESWLQGVPDPYDSAGGNPYHRWNVKMGMATAAGRLDGLVRGRFVGIKITRRGVSPRVVSAQVVGTNGRTTVTGPQLQQRFGLMSTYMSFTSLTTKGARKPTTPKGSSKTTSTGGAGAGAAEPFSPTVAAPGTRRAAGTAVLAALRRLTSVPEVSGSLYPAGRGVRVTVQQRRGRRFVTVARVRTRAGGVYSARVPAAGRYRVIADGLTGPVVLVP